jgi:cytochrome b561
MALRSSADHWGLVSRIWHWGTLALLVVIVPLGVYMADLPKGIAKLRLYALHKSIGITILGIVVLRTIWRLVDGRPAEVPMPPWQARAATGLQGALYLLLLGVPLAGWLMNSAAGFPLRWFGIVNLPALMRPDHPLQEVLASVHVYAAWTLVVLACGHAAAAFKHHYVDRDATLLAMLSPRLLRRDKGAR